MGLCVCRTGRGCLCCCQSVECTGLVNEYVLVSGWSLACPCLVRAFSLLIIVSSVDTSASSLLWASFLLCAMPRFATYGATHRLPQGAVVRLLVVVVVKVGCTSVGDACRGQRVKHVFVIVRLCKMACVFRVLRRSDVELYPDHCSSDFGDRYRSIITDRAGSVYASS